MAERFNASRRESVWLDTDIQETPEFKALDPGAFGFWWRLPFLVDDDHVTPELAVIANDGDIPEHKAARYLSALVKVGLVEPMADGRYHMTARSQRFYTFTQAEADAREAAKEETEDEA